MCESTEVTPDLGFLRYAFQPSPVGNLIVLMSDHGIVDIILSDSHLHPLTEAIRRYPGVGFLPAPGSHRHWVTAAVSRLESPRVHAPFPVDPYSAGRSPAADPAVA